MHSGDLSLPKLAQVASRLASCCTSASEQCTGCTCFSRSMNQRTRTEATIAETGSLVRADGLFSIFTFSRCFPVAWFASFWPTTVVLLRPAGIGRLVELSATSMVSLRMTTVSLHMPPSTAIAVGPVTSRLSLVKVNFLAFGNGDDGHGEHARRPLSSCLSH